MTAHQKIEVAHANVFSALCAAQMEMGPLVKGSVNPAFKSKYADLSDLVTAVRGPLNANGLAYFHQIISLEGERHMRTLLVHGPSDTRIECDVPLIVAKNDMQGMKSATTYAKRIGLESVTGVAADDDDGNAAAAAAPARQQPAQKMIEADKPKPEDSGTLCEKMVGALRAKGASVSDNPGFKADLARLRSLSAEMAGRVDAEIDTQRGLVEA